MKLKTATSIDNLRKVIIVTDIAYRISLSGDFTTPSYDDIRLLQKDVESGRITVLMAIIEGRIAGCVRYEIGETFIQFSKLVVLPEYRQRGVGRRLIRVVEEIARERGFDVHLICAREKEGLESFYKSFGYRVIKETARPDQEGYPPHTELLMVKKID